MTPVSLFLVLVAVAGISVTRWAARMAPLWSEFPAKTLIATVLAGLGVATGLTWLRAPAGLVTIASVVGPLYVFGPVGLVALVRAGRWRVARGLEQALYWTADGRAAVGRLLAQAALQEGDPEAALELAPRKDPLLLSQAYLLLEEWDEVLKLDLAPRTGAGATLDNAFLGAAARIEALVELGNLEQARMETQALRSRFEAGRQGPLGYRAVVLSEARVAAEEGDFERTRELIEQPLAGARPATLYAILARAAVQSGRPDVGVRAYTAAHGVSSGVLRDRFERRLVLLGETPPAAQRRAVTPVATYALGAVLAAAYVVQVLADRWYGVVRALGQAYEVSAVVAAYLQNLPGLPAVDAWWRYLSYAFVHGNLIHIGFNLWVLFDLGRLYERRREWPDVVAAFVAGTAGGAALTHLMQAGQPLILVGASGGILGIAGALLADALAGRSPADRLLLRSLLQWMALLMVFSFAVPGVSLWGHVGGVVGGLAWGLVRRRMRGGTAARQATQAVGFLAIGLLALAVTSALTTVLPLLP